MEKIGPESIHEVIGEEITAGTIAKKFVDATRNVPKIKKSEEIKALALQFMDLVQKRNDIITITIFRRRRRTINLPLQQ